MPHVTLKSWCLKKRLDHGDCTHLSDLAKDKFKLQILKNMSEKMSFINLENLLFLSHTNVAVAIFNQCFGLKRRAHQFLLREAAKKLKILKSLI
jgi:hypothetical protein